MSKNAPAKKGKNSFILGDTKNLITVLGNADSHGNTSTIHNRYARHANKKIRSPRHLAQLSFNIYTETKKTEPSWLPFQIYHLFCLYIKALSPDQNFAQISTKHFAKLTGMDPVDIS